MGDGIGTPPTGCNDKGTGSCAAVGNVLSWLTEETFKQMAPLAFPGGKIGWIEHTACRCAYNKTCGPNETFYTYDAFVKALKGSPDIFIDKSSGKVANDDEQKRVLAGFFANVAQETNGTDSNSWDAHGMLCWVGEMGHDDSQPAPATCGYDGLHAPNGYCYNGRGPLQLTYKYNYESFSQAYFGDDRGCSRPYNCEFNRRVFFCSRSLVFSNYVKDHNGWREGPKGLSQYMISPRKFNGKKRDLAYTIFLINGGIECGTVGHVQAQHRVLAFKTWYKDFTGTVFNDPDDKLECDDMTHAVSDAAMVAAPKWS